MISKKYIGFRVQQRKNTEAISFFVFIANAKDISRWAAIDRLEERLGGIQRRLSQARLRAINRFFEQDKRNIIPTSIVVAFKPDIAIFSPIPISKKIGDHLKEVSCEWGILSFNFDPDVSPDKRPALIVDGQHRLLGMAGVNEDLPLIVSALLDAESNEQAFQFIVINNKVSRVSSDLVRSLIVDFNEEALQQRLESARVSLQTHALLVAVVDDEPESPFYKMVNWERRRGEGIFAIKPAAIEESMKYIRYRFPQFEDDEDGLIDFFYGLWNGVKRVYPQLWERTENRLFENAGFKAFTEFLTDQVEALAGLDYVDISSLESIADATKNIVSQIDVSLWLAEWNLKSLDTSAGREIIKNDIKLIRQNFKDKGPWEQGLTLIGMQEEDL